MSLSEVVTLDGDGDGVFGGLHNEEAGVPSSDMELTLDLVPVRMVFNLPLLNGVPVGGGALANSCLPCRLLLLHRQRHASQDACMPQVLLFFNNCQDRQG